MSTQPVSVSVNSLWFEEQFKCCICLDIYRDPVSTPCGHNFCLDCIEGYWETKSRPECPLCKETFSSRPELRINHGFKEIIQHFETSLSNPGQDNDPSTFGLTDPATFSTSHLCRRHNKPLEMFCKKDQTPVCSSCTARDHRNHPTVPIDRACKKVKVSLKETKAQIKKMMQERIHKTEEIQQAVDQSKKVMERQIQQSVEVCTMLISAVERQQSTVVEELQRRQEEVEEKANQMINHLQAELKALQTRGIEIVNLQATQNPLEMLQTFPSVNKLPLTQDWTQVKVYPDSGTGAIRDGVTEMMEICQKVRDKLLEEEVEKLSQYALDVTYDPDTASGWLEISADGKQVSLCSQKKKLPVTDNDKRFDSCVCVLGKENFSSGRQYWEVQVGDKTDWDVGVAQESVQRKGTIVVRPDAGFWSICRRRGSLGACTSPSLPLPLTPPPQRVGVYVDYEQRCVSFYDAELKKLIYSFTDCDFSGAVVPYFNPCVQDNGKTPPLVICPVVKSTRDAPKDLIMRTTV